MCPNLDGSEAHRQLQLRQLQLVNYKAGHIPLLCSPSLIRRGKNTTFLFWKVSIRKFLLYDFQYFLFQILVFKIFVIL